VSDQVNSSLLLLLGTDPAVSIGQDGPQSRFGRGDKEKNPLSPPFVQFIAKSPYQQACAVFFTGHAYFSFIFNYLFSIFDRNIPSEINCSKCRTKQKIINIQANNSN
jgi:hypothetical protein